MVASLQSRALQRLCTAQPLTIYFVDLDWEAHLGFELSKTPSRVAPGKGVQEACRVYACWHDLDADVPAIKVQHDGPARGDVLHAQHARAAGQKMPGVVEGVEACMFEQDS